VRARCLPAPGAPRAAYPDELVSDRSRRGNEDEGEVPDEFRKEFLGSAYTCSKRLTQKPAGLSRLNIQQRRIEDAHGSEPVMGVRLVSQNGGEECILQPAW